MMNEGTSDNQKHPLLHWLLQRHPETPKTRAKQWITAGRVSVSGAVVRKRDVLRSAAASCRFSPRKAKFDACRHGQASFVRSMRTLPGFSGFTFDFIAPSQSRREAQLRTMATWDRVRSRPGRPASQLLLGDNGNVDIPAVLRLLKQRGNRPILLRE